MCIIVPGKTEGRAAKGGGRHLVVDGGVDHAVADGLGHDVLGIGLVLELQLAADAAWSGAAEQSTMQYG